jgi:HAD superfamily hydrolase (TIGR01509 family)
MNELKALIFDVDGTLANNEQSGHRVAFNLAFADAGLDWSWDRDTYADLLETFGGKERLLRYLEEYRPEFDPPTGRERFIREVHRQKTRRYQELLNKGSIPLRPGVARLLREAHQAGLRLAIASTTTEINATTLLSNALGEQSLSWFDAFACGDVVAAKKPAPDIFLYALRRLGLTADECIAMEDSDSGLASAMGAGLLTVITVNESTRDQDFPGAAIVLDQLGEPWDGFQVLAGDAEGATLVDVAFLRRLHRRRQSAGRSSAGH